MEARVSFRRKTYQMLGGEGHRSLAVKLVDLAHAREGRGLSCPHCGKRMTEPVTD